MTNPETGHRKGLLAEMKAAAYLRLKGYAILETRFKTKYGEVDLIARKEKTLIFAEVKLRRSLDDAAEAIHAANQQRVTQAAQLYLQKHPEYNDFDIRFDALVLARGFALSHIENAWGI